MYVMCLVCVAPVALRGNVALARNLHTRHSNAKLDCSQATIKGITRQSLLT